MDTLRADLGGALVAEAPTPPLPPQNVYHELAGKLLETVVQVQLHLIYIYGQ